MNWLIAAILKPFWPIIAAAGVALVAFVSGDQRGKLKERQRATQRTIDTMRDAKDVQEEVRSTSSDDVHKRLSKWDRD